MSLADGKKGREGKGRHDNGRGEVHDRVDVGEPELGRGRGGWVYGSKY